MVSVMTRKNALRYHKAKVVPIAVVRFVVPQQGYIDRTPQEQLEYLFA